MVAESSSCLSFRQSRGLGSELADARPALPVARPFPCHAGLPRDSEQTRQVERLHVVAESLVRLGSAPVATSAVRSTSFALSVTFRPPSTSRCTASQRRLPALRTFRLRTSLVPDQFRN